MPNDKFVTPETCSLKIIYVTAAERESSVTSYLMAERRSFMNSKKVAIKTGEHLSNYVTCSLCRARGFTPLFQGWVRPTPRNSEMDVRA